MKATGSASHLSLGAAERFIVVAAATERAVLKFVCSCSLSFFLPFFFLKEFLKKIAVLGHSEVMCSVHPSFTCEGSPHHLYHTFCGGGGVCSRFMCPKNIGVPVLKKIILSANFPSFVSL